MSDIDKITKTLVEAVKESDRKKTNAYDTIATVRRISGDTAWVHVPGGVDETPVKMTVNASAGDVVQVRIGGGRAWITGNASAPPTDDKEAFRAYNAAMMAETSAQVAKDSADKAVADAARAHTAADQAQYSANQARDAARDANTAANNALMGLGTVESVLDVINWFAEHKKASTDTTVDPTKSYYTYDPDTGILQRVQPEGDEDPSAEGWYEIDEAIADYVGTHLALTDEGLNVVGAAQGWRVVIAAGGGTLFPDAGVYLVDPQGNIAQQTNANGVAFNTGKPVTIGDNTAFITFDGNGHIAMIGADVTIGGANNVNGVLTVKNSTGNTIGTWDNTKLEMQTAYGYIKADYLGTFTVFGDSSQDDALVLDSLVHGTAVFNPNSVEMYHTNDTTTPRIAANIDSVAAGHLSVKMNNGYGVTIDGRHGSHDAPAITLKGATSSSLNVDIDSANPKLIFQNSNASQNIAFVFNDYDTYQAPASLTLSGNQGGEYFITPNLRVGSDMYMSNNGFIYTKTSGGTVVHLAGMNTSNQMFFGYGSYNTNTGESYFDGNKVYIRSKTSVTIDAPSGLTLPASTTATLSTATATNTSYITAGNVTFYRRGFVVTVYGSPTVSALSSRTQIAIIPAGYRPVQAYIGHIAGTTTQIIFNTDGKLTMDATTAGQKWFTETYVIG